MTTLVVKVYKYTSKFREKSGGVFAWLKVIYILWCSCLQRLLN